MENDYDYLTVQFKGSRDGWCVYGWGTYPESSVLAGQSMKRFLDSFESKEEALKAYPQAEPSSDWLEPQVSLGHLPGEDDPVPGGMYPDDY
jgi:hypothetical protein